MKLRVLPVHVVGQWWHVFPQPDQQLRVTMNPADAASGVAEIHGALYARLQCPAEFLPAFVADESTRPEDLAAAAVGAAADVLIVNLSAACDAALFAQSIPVIAFAGENTPMMALYTLPPAVRRGMPNLHLALDHAEVDGVLRGLLAEHALARLRGARMLVLGEYRCFERLPDPVQLAQRLGVELLHLSGAAFLEAAAQVPSARVEEVAARWRREALAVDEPDEEDLNSAARLFVALHDRMLAERADAVSVGCLEVMYGHAVRPFCFVLATLRDMGLPAGCESDATATLTMLVLEHIAGRPAYMGNLVLADPAANLVAVSHGCSPRFMYGRDAPALPYRLVHSHSVPPFTRGPKGGAGLTSYVDYGHPGQPVTLCRIAAELDEFFVAGGKIVECRDTVCDRTTLSVRVADARAYAHRATGNHQVLVYGDFRTELRAFCRAAGMRFVDGEEALVAHA